MEGARSNEDVGSRNGRTNEKRRPVEPEDSRANRGQDSAQCDCGSSKANQYRRMKKIWNEFQEFAVKGNAVDLAVGVIIGAAFGSIVNSLVKDVIMRQSVSSPAD